MSLERIAASEDTGIDWPQLRTLIRNRLEQNVSLYTEGPPPPPVFNPVPSTQGGLRLRPFPQKKLSQLHMYDPPLSYMTPAQAKDALQAVFDQLDSFDDPPFTIQRLCELLLTPKKHYKSVGKYLRAVEKSILVTSSLDSFPVEPAPHPPPSNGSHHPTPLAFATRSTPSTPLFSPIAFLHEDARLVRSRSRSRSISPTRGLGDREHTQPPPSPTPDSEPGTPLLLSAELPSKPDEDIKQESVGIGMVDEMDDPSPGHLSETPTPLTTIAGGRKPFLGSLRERFVKSTDNSDDKASSAKKPKVELEENKMDLDTEPKPLDA